MENWQCPIKAEEDNYSITIRDQKDFGDLKSNFGKSLYSPVPMLKPRQKLRCIVDKSRINKFMSSYSEKAELAKLELEGRQNQSLFEDSQEINFEDLLGFFQGEDNDDVIEL